MYYLPIQLDLRIYYHPDLTVEVARTLSHVKPFDKTYIVYRKDNTIEFELRRTLLLLMFTNSLGRKSTSE